MQVPATRAIGVAVITALISAGLSACNRQAGQPVTKPNKILAIRPEARSVNITHEYFCQIHAQRHIKVCPQVKGYLEEILVKPGQGVKAGDPMFKVMPKHYQTKLDAMVADARLAEIELDDAKEQSADKPATQKELAVREAKLAKARAHVTAELEHTTVKAPFDGVVERLHHPQGSLVDKGEILTTLSDHSQLRVYFHVPESRYLEYMADLKKHQEDLQVELLLSDGKKYDQPGKIGAIDASFDKETGNIGYRADFPNPDGRLRHGQTGHVLVHIVLRDAIVIPQRATFEILHKRYVFVVDDDHVAHRREIGVQHELDDIFVVKSGLDLTDRIVLEGVRNVSDGDTVDEDGQAEK